MTITNQMKYEVELVERLWSRGWATFRTASPGPNAMANADVIAMRDGVVFVGNVVVLETGTSTRNIREKNTNLKKIKRRADAAGMGMQNEIKVGTAVKKDYEDEWYYCHIDQGKAKASASYLKLDAALKSW